MIKIAKKPSFSLKTFNFPLPLKIIFYTAVFLSLYILLPLSLTSAYNSIFPAIFVLFHALNLTIAIILIKMNSDKRNLLKYRTQGLQEKINILDERVANELKNKFALKEKIRRYDNLKKIIEEINRSLSLESVAEHLVSIAFSLIANNKGICILYLVDSQTNSTLFVFKTKKEDKKLIVKAKEGDMFDLWVLTHTSPLFVENMKKDFRFDLEKLDKQDTRAVSSLIATPLISEHRFMGILRLDHSDQYFYSQDDLRLLVAIADLGAVALENAELFKKTQDLAIHDELTSFYTKGYFLERLKEEYGRSKRQNRPLSLLMLDIDFFKIYNDNFGHTAGDMVLKSLSKNISEELEGLSPVISRFGGEEFCIIIAGMDTEKAREIAEGLRKKIENTKITLRRQETSVTVSVGVAGALNDISDENELIIRADRAMYEAKQKGRNRVCGA